MKMYTAAIIVVLLSGFTSPSQGQGYKRSLGQEYQGNQYVYSYSLVKPESTQGMNWEDDKIAIAFLVGDKEVNFRLRNKTDNAMKILWDEASIIQFGRVKKVMHKGVRYVNRDQSQPPTVVPGKAMLEDLIVPSDNVWYRRGYYSGHSSVPGGWEKHDLFPTTDMNKEEYRRAILSSKGQTFKVYLPIQYQANTINYTFEFLISDVRQVSK